jgi:hypothetical protein
VVERPGPAVFHRPSLGEAAFDGLAIGVSTHFRTSSFEVSGSSAPDKLRIPATTRVHHIFEGG